MNADSFTLGNIRLKMKMILDAIRGLDFFSVILPDEVGLDPEIAYRSAPSGDKYLHELLMTLGVLNDDAILDLGCGKGSALRTMLKFPFERIDGIELSPQISNIAIENFRLLRKEKVHIYLGEASEFEGFDIYNFIYLYNPFPEVVMAKVVSALSESLKRKDREIVIIYNNPVCHDEVVRSGVFSKISEHPDKWGNGIFIYSNYPGRSRIIE